MSTGEVVCYKADETLGVSEVDFEEAVKDVAGQNTMSPDSARDFLLTGNVAYVNGHKYSIDRSNFDQPATPEIVEVLTDDEAKEFDELEQIVDTSVNKMLETARQIGEALSKIKEKKYYKKLRPGQQHPTFSNFGEYVKYKYDRGRTMAHNYMVVHETMSLLQEGGAELPEGTNISTILTLNKEVRSLIHSADVDSNNVDVDRITRDLAVKGWELIVSTAPANEQGHAIVTPEHVHVAMDVLHSVIKTGVVEIDGEQVPVSLATLAVNDQVTEALNEQVQRRRQQIYEHTVESKKRRLDEVPPADDRPSKNIGTETGFFTIECSKHGATKPKSLIRGGFRAVCGCVALITIVSDDESVFVREDDESSNA